MFNLFCGKEFFFKKRKETFLWGLLFGVIELDLSYF